MHTFIYYLHIFRLAINSRPLCHRLFPGSPIAFFTSCAGSPTAQNFILLFNYRCLMAVFLDIILITILIESLEFMSRPSAMLHIFGSLQRKDRHAAILFSFLPSSFLRFLSGRRVGSQRALGIQSGHRLKTISN